jgi:GT2 family glycosyltransferase
MRESDVLHDADSSFPPPAGTAGNQLRADIIILSWDRVDDTLQSIESALAQRGVDIRVCVIDQGTKPEDLERLKGFCSHDPRITLIVNALNTGVPGGRNQAIRLGSAPYVVALDNDAVFADADQVARAVAIAERNPDVAALAFRIMLFDQDADDPGCWVYNKDVANWAGRWFETIRFVGAGHLLQRRAFESVGGYDESLFFLHEELDLAFRLINRGMKIMYTPDVVVRHKVSGQNRVAWSSGRYFYHVRNTIYLRMKFNFSLLSTIPVTIMLVVSGCKMGFWVATFRGVGAGMILAPRALRFRLLDSQTRLSSAVKAKLRSMSETAGMTLGQRLVYRLRPKTMR